MTDLVRDRATKGNHPLPGALMLALGLAIAFCLTAGAAAGVFARGSWRDPLNDIGGEAGRISFRQPGGRHTVLDLATGAVVERGWRGPVGWRPPHRCELRESVNTCEFPNGVFRFGDSRLEGRTDAGEWKAFHFPANNSHVVAMYGIGDKVLIESTGRLVSNLECIEARSGRSVWTYLWSDAYNAEASPWAPYIPGPPFAEWPERAQAEVRFHRFGVHVVEDPSSVGEYEGSLVTDPRASEAPAAHRRAIAIGWAALAVAVATGVAASRRRHANGMVACLLLQGLLLLTVGYVDTWLLMFLGLAFGATAVLAATLSRGAKRVFVALVVLGTAGLWILPLMLRSLVRT